MATYSSNTTIEQAANRLLGAQRILLTTHAKPDGDAFGSVVALADALGQMGKSVQAWLMPPMPTAFQSLRGAELTQSFESSSLEEHAQLIGDPDLTVIVDTGAWAQLAPMRPVLEPLVDRMLILDHHLTGDVPAAHRHVNTGAAACCEIVGDVILAMTSLAGGSSTMTPTVCDALYLGIASDTGWFHFSNTTASTHEWAARLLRAGVDHADLYAKLEQQERPEKLALFARALQQMQLLADNRAAVITLSANDFAATGARIDETERLADLPRMVGSVLVVAVVVEPPTEPGASQDIAAERPPIRLSFRSKPGPGAVDVAALASRFGGGGHARAAGAKVAGDLAAVAAQVKQACVSAVEQAAIA